MAQDLFISILPKGKGFEAIRAAYADNNHLHRAISNMQNSGCKDIQLLKSQNYHITIKPLTLSEVKGCHETDIHHLKMYIENNYSGGNKAHQYCMKNIGKIICEWFKDLSAHDVKLKIMHYKKEDTYYGKFIAMPLELVSQNPALKTKYNLHKPHISTIKAGKVGEKDVGGCVEKLKQSGLYPLPIEEGLLMQVDSLRVDFSNNMDEGVYKLFNDQSCHAELYNMEL